MITPNPTPEPAPPVVIVGAGSAGLATAAALQQRGIHAVILEQGNGVATSWRNRHGELRLNTIRWLSDLPGLRIPSNRAASLHVRVAGRRVRPPPVRRCTVTQRRVLLAAPVHRWVGRAMARILPDDLHDVFEPGPE